MRTRPSPSVGEASGRTYIPRAARWIELITSRASVSLDRQALAPRESMRLQSAGEGLLASTTKLVPE